MSRFEKVSYKQFKEDYVKLFGETVDEQYIKEFYNNIKLPKRATVGSAGYDFFSPFDIEFVNGGDITIPTGIRVVLDDGYFLMCVPRSGLGFKHYTRLANTTGIIDSDYSFSPNEGHIMAKMRCENSQEDRFRIVCGSGFMQGIILSFHKTEDDEVTDNRTGGFGSTTK